MIVNGKAVGDKDVWGYYRDIDSLKPAVKEAFSYLDERYECVIAEGAGSPVELNLMSKDLSNLFIADAFDTKIILVADIEKGGVFASIWGVYNLLPKKLRDNVIGVIVNKFRGDRELFDSGVAIIEREFGIPVLGVLPYRPFNLGFEDSQSLVNFVQSKPLASQRIAVICYPHMSNYNDLEPLIADERILVEFIHAHINLSGYDTVILPGSKLVVEDLQWLKKNGLFSQLQSLECKIMGICGGYEMMFEAIVDEYAVECDKPVRERGLGFVDDVIVFQRDKVLKKGVYQLFGRAVNGFEIHHGASGKYPLFYDDGRIQGTFVHGIFDDQQFHRYKQMAIGAFVEEMRQHIDVQRVVEAIC
jgi:adenosylcobyric acid synthase